MGADPSTFGEGELKELLNAHRIKKVDPKKEDPNPTPTMEAKITAPKTITSIGTDGAAEAATAVAAEAATAVAAPTAPKHNDEEGEALKAPKVLGATNSGAPNLSRFRVWRNSKIQNEAKQKRELSTSKAEKCRNFIANKCKHGLNCKFSHDEPPSPLSEKIDIQTGNFSPEIETKNETDSKPDSKSDFELTQIFEEDAIFAEGIFASYCLA
jgi:hypothetical protein